MRVYLDQIGCRLNYSENDTLATQLRAVGHQMVSRAEDAQVVVFNTCAVTAGAVRSNRQRIRHLHRVNPNARIAVTGCWATLQPEAAASLPGVQMVADNGQKELLATLLEPWSVDFDEPGDLARLSPSGTPFADESSEITERRNRTRAFVKVQDGCNNKCTFCIVTVARGQSRSRATADIVAEVQRLVEEGTREAVLTGVHLGAYGRDFDGAARTDLKQLTEAILSDTDIERLRLSSLEPWELADGFFDLWQRWPRRLCPHLHLPLQAGTDKQLRRMARRCTVESFRQLVADARAAIDDLVLTSDLIVGFPGETEADFETGLAFTEEMRFAHAHIFPFSAREGTAAARFGEHVTKAVKKERSRRLHEVVAGTGAAERQRFVGDTRPVLWEGEGQPLADAPKHALWTGYTDNYLRVMASAPAKVDLHGEITPARLEAVEDETMVGTICQTED